ncbi:sensor histidine kinase [Aliiruegeria lutimaris]|uniref:histidine kinase n=1 Tax=Aliiruegeria lutimaris TaxID=571298 RepID=A0A1G9AML9_9RHOB|nr:sensor histidine kinase [Aliiruegeria lutimaris]SDK28491.1 two-component system, OmpR family, sensor histidine kinase TctE [Aliiruegeria lutimaris]
MSDKAVITGSIRRRLTFRLLLSSALLAGLLFVIVLNFAEKVAQVSQDNILDASVTSILESATVLDGEISIDIPYAAMAMLGNVSDDRVFYRVTVDGAHLTGYEDLPRSALQANERGRSYDTVDFLGESVRMATASRLLARGQRPIHVTVSVAQTRGGAQETLQEIWRNAVYLGIGFFAVAGALAVAVAQSAIDPLERLAASVSRRGPQDLRPVVAEVPREMAPLVEALNRLIGRLQITLTRSEDFMAEAAHRVRTPLATVRAQAEIALNRMDKPENRASLNDMIHALDESSRAAGQLLDHAMVTFRTDQLEHVPLRPSDLIAETVRRLQPVAGLKDIAITVVAPTDLRVTGDPILIQNALGNLLDNAVKYSPAESDIAVDMWAEDGACHIQVSDQGAGFPKGAGKRLTRRFARGSNSQGTVGSGLGLTIADEVAQAHGGRLELEQNPEGVGACVSLVLPLS